MDFQLKTRRHLLACIAHIIFYITPPSIQASASLGVIQHGLGATLVCPFTVIGGPKSIGTVTVSCYSDTGCSIFANINGAWGGRGGQPTLTNGSHSLSNDAMTSAGLTTACANATPTTQCIKLQVQKPNSSSVSASLSMEATVDSGVFVCTTSGTLDISSF